MLAKFQNFDQYYELAMARANNDIRPKDKLILELLVLEEKICTGKIS